MTLENAQQQVDQWIKEVVWCHFSELTKHRHADGGSG